MSMNIFIGDEIYFKDISIKECIDSIGSETDILTIDLDEQKKIDQLLLDMHSHLLSYDFFGKSKVGILRTKSLAKATSTIDFFLQKNLEGSVLILDVFSSEGKQLSEFKKKDTIKQLPKTINLKYFMALKTYEEYKLKPFVEEKLTELGLQFSTKEDYDKSVEYIVMNSKLSYSCAYNEIRKLKYLNKSDFNYKKIVDTISDNLCTDRYYILDKLLESTNHNEAMEVLDTYLPKFKKTDLEAILTDISNFTKDYLVFNKTGTCMQKSNYYKFKKLKFKIVNAKEFLLNINRLLAEARKGNPTVADYLFLYIFEHFVFNV